MLRHIVRTAASNYAEASPTSGQPGEDKGLMMRFLRLTGVLAVLGAIFVTTGAAADVNHGIGFTKGCTSPTKIGDPYSCSFTVRNILDQAQDTLTINSLVDVVHSASGDVNSGNILGSVSITVASGATCVASGGNGTLVTPYTGVTSCTLPFGARVNVLSSSHYTVQPG